MGIEERDGTVTTRRWDNDCWLNQYTSVYENVSESSMKRLLSCYPRENHSIQHVEDERGCWLEFIDKDDQVPFFQWANLGVK